MPYNKGKLHWITLRCIFPEAHEDCKEGYVYSIDYASDGEENLETKKARLWFAKLMGIYFDILTKNEGYAGPEDIYASFHGTHLQYSVHKHEYFSLINNIWTQKILQVSWITTIVV